MVLVVVTQGVSHPNEHTVLIKEKRSGEVKQKKETFKAITDWKESVRFPPSSVMEGALLSVHAVRRGLRIDTTWRHPSRTRAGHVQEEEEVRDVFHALSFQAEQ